MGREIVVVMILLGGIVAGVGLATGAADESVRITNSGVAESNVVTTRGGVTYLWASSSLTVRVELATTVADGSGTYDVCVASVPSDATTPAENGTANTTTASGAADGTATDTAGNETRELACRTVELTGGETRSLEFSFDSWPGEMGVTTLRSTVRTNTLQEEVVATDTQTIRVLGRDGDADRDGVTNERELSVGTDLDESDTDGDGLADGVELDTYGTNPTEADTDGDGLSDGREVSAFGTNPTEPDTDGDGLADGEEVSEYGTDPTVADTDGDGLTDERELTAAGTNATNPDTDGDGLADGVEVNEYGTNPLASDTDGDGLSDTLEVTTYDTDPTDADTDGDGLSDGREVTTHSTNPTDADTDGDGLADGEEVSEYGTDPTRADTDGDGVSDARELRALGTDPTVPDTDGDGVADGAETTLLPRPPSPAELVSAALFLAVLFGIAYVTRSVWLDRAPTTVRDAATADPVQRVAGRLRGGSSELRRRLRAAHAGLTGRDPTGRHTRDPLAPDSAGGSSAVRAGDGEPTASDQPTVTAEGDGSADSGDTPAATADTTTDTARDATTDTPADLTADTASRPTADAPDGSTADAPDGSTADAPDGSTGGSTETPADSTAGSVATASGTDGATSESDGAVADTPERATADTYDAGERVAGEHNGAGHSDDVSADRDSRADDRAAPTDDADDTSEEPPERRALDLETMAKEDAVRTVIAANGGRMRQSALVEETGWSKATVSRVLSRMDDDGEVTKITVGRSNVVALPGTEPYDAPDEE